MDVFSATLYAEVDILCMIILSIIIYKIIRTAVGLTDRLMAATLCTFMVFLFTDLVWGFTEYRVWDVPLNVKYIANTVYYLSGAVASCLWFVYCEEMRGSSIFADKKRLVLTMIPFAVYLVILFSTPYTRLFFYLDEAGDYHRGYCYGLHLVLAYSYMAVATVRTFCSALKKENYANRQRYLALSGFVVPPILFSVAQQFLMSVPLLAPSMTLAGFLVYINLQELQISRDPLTGINNRAHLINYMEMKIRHSDGGKIPLHLMMVDVDFFKEINDRFGHTEGDAALVRVAQALKKGCAAGCFVARYGGDEFSILCDNMSDAAVEELCRKLPMMVTAQNIAAYAPYALKISIGCARYKAEYRTIPDFIAAADRQLYEVKEMHHREANARRRG